MKAKKVPMRMCTGCGEMFDKRTLVRVVKSPDGEVSLDLTGKKSGRGAYVCKNAECLKKARKKRKRQVVQATVHNVRRQKRRASKWLESCFWF